MERRRSARRVKRFSWQGFGNAFRDGLPRVRTCLLGFDVTALDLKKSRKKMNSLQTCKQSLPSYMLKILERPKGGYE